MYLPLRTHDRLVLPLCHEGEGAGACVRKGEGDMETLLIVLIALAWVLLPVVDTGGWK